jgi:hypothetical protein
MYYRKGAFWGISGRFGESARSAKTTEIPWFFAFLGLPGKRGKATDERLFCQSQQARFLPVDGWLRVTVPVGAERRARPRPREVPRQFAKGTAVGWSPGFSQCAADKLAEAGTPTPTSRPEELPLSRSSGAGRVPAPGAKKIKRPPAIPSLPTALSVLAFSPKLRTLKARTGFSGWQASRARRRARAAPSSGGRRGFFWPARMARPGGGRPASGPFCRAPGR